MPLVELKNVSKNYDGRNIISNISLSIPANSLVAITGKSGSGKSTILNMIGLLESVDSGQIMINGTKIPGINTVKAMKLRRDTINYLFQSYALINDITVYDNLLLAMKFVDSKKKEKTKQINQVLEDLDIAVLKDKKINTLSGGEQQRVALARCILKPGDLILADEPTGSLDPNMANTAFQLINNLRDQYQKTVIMVTHDMALAEKADYIIDLDKLKI